MASLGLPGLAGFWGEFPAILSAYSPVQDTPFGSLSEPLFRTLMVIAAMGTVLAAGYLLWLYQRTAFGEVNPEFAGHARPRALASVRAGQRRAPRRDPRRQHLRVDRVDAAAASRIVVLGVYPQLMFKIMDPAVAKLVKVFNK